jgi:Arc/MetJ family transcription regulator
MRTNIELDNALLAEAMSATGQRTKRGAVEEALQTLVRIGDEIGLIRKYTREDEPKDAPAKCVTRTNIDIDDDLMTRALRTADVATKREAVEEALRAVIRISRQRQALDDLRGIGWDGNLDEMRGDWLSTPA